MLSDNLDDIEETTPADRTSVAENPVRVASALTDRGTRLAPVIEEMSEWGREHLVSTGNRDASMA